MRLRPEQLAGHLGNPLLPIYVISGDEPLQTGEATDAIREAARAQGFTEREVMHAETGFDWNLLSAAADALSLFAERRILDLRIPGGKPGDAGGKALSAYAERPPEDNILLVTLPRLDKRQQQSKWFKALDAAGAVVQVWPVGPKELPGWISQRMRARGLESRPEVVRLLADKVEGNLLAAAQEVDKLHLLFGEGAIDLDEVALALADSSRFDVFELVDTALSGDAARTARILDGLYAEGVEPVLILWALAREIRSLAAMAASVAQGSPPEQVMRQHRVWAKRQAPVRSALQRHNAPRWEAFLARAGRVDRTIKGAEPGNPRDELLQLALLVAGVRIV
ncbi:DNA polymerase III subunit delta [Thiohalomonas denitrificans]|uniref:DNA polymerase III subunit delta n=1 Tax=Thiohalomonas denitrificans TaxID=415747 RepID=A0A1G5PMW7_9GAMM|nr:DNA polymerase III subunit delta [Thiohalomonas denitrificans]SCZ50803.1 DNA polymerase III, delta subunit [Thiohalomonas denitrificans]